jgi:hypothetical protein
MKLWSWACLVAAGASVFACGKDDEPAADFAADAGGDAARPSATSSSSSSSGAAASSSSSGSTPYDGSAATDTYGQLILADGPVGYWRLGDAAGTTAKDEIGNAHPGTYFGGVTLGEPGVTGANTAARFDGTTGCIGVGEFFRFPGRVPYSAEGWVKLTEYGAEGTRIISTEGFPTGVRSGWNLSASYGDTGYPYFDSWSSEGTDNQYVMGAYSKVSPDEGTLILNEWNHVVGTFDDTQESIWVNGVLRDRVRQSTLNHPNQGTFSIGCASNGSGAIYLGAHGAIDEVAVYDKVLTDAQVMAHFAAGKP